MKYGKQLFMVTLVLLGVFSGALAASAFYLEVARADLAEISVNTLGDNDGKYWGTHIGIRTSGNSPQRVMDIAHHEIAHHQHNKMRKSLKNQYLELYDTTDHVSNYAATSVNEGFAETFEIMSGLCYYEQAKVDEEVKEWFVNNVYSEYGAQPCGDK